MMVWPNSGESSFWAVPISLVRAKDYVAVGTFTTRNCNGVSYLGDCAVSIRHGSCVSFGNSRSGIFENKQKKRRIYAIPELDIENTRD